MLIRTGNTRRGGPAPDAHVHGAAGPGIGLSVNHLQPSVSARNVIKRLELGPWLESQSLPRFILEQSPAGFSSIHANLAPTAF